MVNDKFLDKFLDRFPTAKEAFQLSNPTLEDARPVVDRWIQKELLSEIKRCIENGNCSTTIFSDGICFSPLSRYAFRDVYKLIKTRLNEMGYYVIYDWWNFILSNHIIYIDWSNANGQN